MDVSVIIVSYNVRDLLERLLRSLRASLAESVLTYEILVVDNASGDGSVQMIWDKFPGVQVLVNQRNLGFTAANNQALVAARGRSCLLLNPDTEVLDQAVSTLVEFMDAHPKVGIAGPQLRWPDGAIQSSRRRFPTWGTAFVESTVLQWRFPRLRLLERYYMADSPDDQTQPVDWVTGAAFIVRREVLDKVGFFDERFFMYSEELDWCFRARKAGWEVWYVPRAVIVHHEGRSSAQNVARRHIYFQDSKIKFFAKHYGRVGAALLRAFILLTFVYQVLEEGLKYLLVRRDRETRRGRIRALWGYVRWQLHLGRVL